MPISIDALFAVLDRVAEALSDEDADAVVSLAEIGLGGFFWSNPEITAPSDDQLVEMSTSGQMYQEGKASLQRRLDYLVSNLHIAEDLVVAGIIQHVTRRMESFSDDMSTSTVKTRDEFEDHRRRLQDPSERQAQAERINAMLPPGERIVSADELLDRLDEMLAVYAAPLDDEELQEARRRLDAWRSAVREVMGDQLSL